MIDHGESGFVVESGNEADLEAKLLEALSLSASQRSVMGKGSASKDCNDV